MIESIAHYGASGKLPLRTGDKIWLGRSLMGETDRSEAGRAAAAWVMLSRTIWLLTQGRTTTRGLPCSQAPTGRGPRELEPVIRPMDFTAGLRCFSSVINSYWTDRVPSKAARRRMVITAPWTTIEQRSPGTRDFVDRFFKGEVPNPYPGAADFDAPDEVPAGAYRIAQVGGNVLMGEPGPPGRGTLAWPPGFIRVEPARGLQALGLNPVTLALGATLTALAIALAVFAFRPRAVANKVPRRRYRQRRQQWALAA